MTRPSGTEPHRLGREYEISLTDDRRRREGIHYTPLPLAETIVVAAFDALGRPPERVLDPSCGGGAILLTVLDEFVARGLAPADALLRITGVDVDEGAVETARTAVATWASANGVGAASVAGSIVVGDALADDWPTGIDLVVGNPPFGGQLRGSTIRDERRAEQARRILGRAAGYADTAGLFLVRAVDEVLDGGVVVLLQPRSVLAARDAGRVRELVDARATVRSVLVPEATGFDASVHVCAPVVVRGVRTTERRSWSELAADAIGLPPADLDRSGLLGDVADATAGFRDEFYAVASFVGEASGDDDMRPRLITSGAIEPGRVLWGERDMTVLRRNFIRPVVDLDGLRSFVEGVDGDRRIAAQLELRRRPKVLVATQTRSIEAVADVDGALWPSVPVVSVLPREVDVWSILAVLASREANAWIARRSVGTGLSPGALRISARMLASIPIPPIAGIHAWDDAADRLRKGAPVDDGSVLDAMSCAYGTRA